MAHILVSCQPLSETFPDVFFLCKIILVVFWFQKNSIGAKKRGLESIVRELMVTFAWFRVTSAKWAAALSRDCEDVPEAAGGCQDLQDPTPASGLTPAQDWRPHR